MASIVVAGDTSGSITIAAPNVAGTNTLTLPANTGTVITTASTFAGTGPAFSATASGGQSISAGTNTKVQFNNEDFDTNSCYDTSTYRFTPNVAGYYQVNFNIGVASYTGVTQSILYKNGSVYISGNYPISSTSTSNFNGGSAIVYLNGTTDYIECYMWSNNASTTSTTADRYKFSAAMVRGA